MPVPRRYGDPCGIARALDVVGDRWALLVVRELIFGPKRFLQVRDGLPGISPNVLSQRLRDLEEGRWGSQEPVTTARELSVSALLVALKTVFDPARAADATYALRVDGQWFGLTVAGGSVDITSGRPQQPTVTLDTVVATLRAVAFGREPVTEAEHDGRLAVHGDRAAAERFTHMFPAPVR